MRPSLIERWVKGEREARGAFRLPTAHDHYCATCDRRWTCRDQPCLKHEAINCPRHES